MIKWFQGHRFVLFRLVYGHLLTIEDCNSHYAVTIHADQAKQFYANHGVVVEHVIGERVGTTLIYHEVK